MKKYFIAIFFGLLVIMALSSCFPVTTTSSIKKPNSGSIYNPFIYRLHPEYFVYNAKSQTRLYTKIYFSELMFAPMGSNKSYEGKVKIEYNIYKPDNLSNYVDSASVIYEIKKRKGLNNAITYLNINDNGLEEYYLHIKTSDLLRQTTVEDFLFVNKKVPSAAQNFLISLKSTNHPYFKNYFRRDHVFSIIHNTPADSVFIRFYTNNLPLPFPPFSSMLRSKIDTESDSSWSVDGKNEFQFNEQKKGLYFIQTDTTDQFGLGLLNAGDDFPYLKTSESLVYPLEYLTSTAEFKELLSSSNKKLAVDKFWQGCGGNLNRARELIRIYYNRTLYANIYFTSFTEGWRTDRGMIYLMFGPPKAVKKTPEKETWIYSDRLNYKVLQFVFIRVSNPYSDNDFVLERNLDFKPFWFKS
ncbi:MAG: GWxTD domain-containing protein, partial [Bacteroidales bacterium]|nr:GWxTD domain-containing protein [Bacteroidales bacterium]